MTPRERAKNIIRAWVKSATNHAHLVVGVDESRVSTEPQVEEATLVALLADTIAAEVQRAVDECIAVLDEAASKCDVEPLNGWNNHYRGDCFREAGELLRVRQRAGG